MQVPTAVEPGLEFVVTATLIVADVGRSLASIEMCLARTCCAPESRHGTLPG